MPVFTKMTEEEVKALLERKTKQKGPSQRQIIRQQYMDYLGQFKPGDFVSVNADEGESRLTVKNRLNKAASELNLQLEYYRARGPIRFRIVHKEEEQAKSRKRSKKTA